MILKTIPAKSDSFSRRLSILKPPKVRQPLQNVDFKASSSENSPTKFKRRVSFAEKKHVKEFCDLMEQGTMWDNTYEENEISNIKSNCVLNCNTSLLETELKETIRDKLENEQICLMNEIDLRDNLHCTTLFRSDLSGMECELDITDAIGGIEPTVAIQQESYIDHNIQQDQYYSRELEAENIHDFQSKENNIQQCTNKTSTNLDGLLQSLNVTNAFAILPMELTTPIETVNSFINTNSKSSEKEECNGSLRKNTVPTNSSTNMNFNINQTNSKVSEEIETSTNMTKQFSTEMSFSKSCIKVSSDLNDASLDTTKNISSLTKVDDDTMEFTSAVQHLNMSSDAISDFNKTNSIPIDKTMFFEDMSMALTAAIPVSVCSSDTNLETNKIDYVTQDSSKMFSVPVNTSSDLNESNCLRSNQTKVLQSISMEITTGVPCSMFLLERDNDLNKINRTVDHTTKTLEKASVESSSKAVNSMAFSSVTLNYNKPTVESDKTKIFQNVSMEFTEGVPISVPLLEINTLNNEILHISSKENNVINEPNIYQGSSNALSDYRVPISMLSPKRMSELNKTHCTLQATTELDDRSMNTDHCLNKTRCVATDKTKIFHDVSMELTAEMPFSVSSLKANTVSLEKSHCMIQDVDEIYTNISAVISSRVIEGNCTEINKIDDNQAPTIEVNNKESRSMLSFQQTTVGNETSCTTQNMTMELGNIPLNNNPYFSHTLNCVRSTDEMLEDISIDFLTDISLTTPISTKINSTSVEAENILQVTLVDSNKSCLASLKAKTDINQVNCPSSETRLISENWCELNRDKLETCSSLSTEHLISRAIAISGTSQSTRSTRENKKDTSFIAINNEQNKGVSLNNKTFIDDEVANAKKQDYDMKTKFLNIDNSKELQSTQVSSFVRSNKDADNSSRTNAIILKLTLNHNKSNSEVRESEKRECLAKSVNELEKTMSPLTASQVTNDQEVDMTHVVYNTRVCNKDNNYDNNFKADQITDCNNINQVEDRKRKRSETFVIRGKTTYNLEDSAIIYEKQANIEDSQNHSVFQYPNRKSVKRAISETPHVSTLIQRESMDNLSKMSNNDQAFIASTSNKNSNTIKTAINKGIIENISTDAVIMSLNSSVKEPSLNEVLAIIVNKDKDMYDNMHNPEKLPNKDNSIKNVESSLHEDHEVMIDEDPFVLLTKTVETYSQSDNCIWDIRSLDRKILAVDFISGSLVVVIFFRDNKESNITGAIRQIKIVSRLADKMDELLSTIHHLILDKVNPEMLTQLYNTYTDVLPLLEYVSKEVKLAVNFMHEFKYLENLNLLDIIDNRITFIVHTNRMEIILKVSIDIKPFDDISLSDVNVSCLLGDIRVNDIKQLIMNVKKDHRFLKRYMNDVKEYIVVMEEINSANKQIS